MKFSVFLLLLLTSRITAFITLNCTNVDANGHLDVPAATTVILSHAFNGCTQLKSITFEQPSSVCDIGEHAFDNSGLEAIEIPPLVPTIESWAFLNAQSLQHVTYACSSQPLLVGMLAFSNTPYAALGRNIPDASCRAVTFTPDCTGVQSDGHITIGAQFSAIGQGAFADCTSLVSVSFESGSALTQIYPSAFQGATRLSKIDLSALTGIVSIQPSTFQNTPSLTEITIPVCVQFIQAYAFAQSGIVTVNYPCGPTSSWVIGVRNAFDGTSYQAAGMPVPDASCRYVLFSS